MKFLVICLLLYVTMTAAPTGGQEEQIAPIATSACLVDLGEYTITAYCACKKCCGKSDGITASGAQATVGRTVAGPKSFPFGTRLYIDGLGERTVEDRGGSIRGNRLDVYFNDHSEALEFGVEKMKVYEIKEDINGNHS